MSREKIDLLRAYGAEVVVCPTDVDPSSPQSYYRVAERLTREIPGGFQPNQYANPANPEAHYLSTGPELWRQSGGKITHFVAGVGTGGTITGVSEVIKPRKPSFRAIAVEPVSSPVITQKMKGEPLKPGRHRIQGIGAGFVPDNLHTQVVDEVIQITDEEAFEWARRLAKEEGIFGGISSGGNIAAAANVAARPENRGKTIVTIMCSFGERYLSTPLFEEE
jgi:cysteine synthase A